MVSERITYYTELLDEELFSYFDCGDIRQKQVLDAMKYSLAAGGKRIRPVLAMEFCRMVCGNEKQALAVACAVEMTHTFSLIHDDLPCMDNDDMRRGKPSCHKAFDEATALLAGDALAVLPYELIARWGEEDAANSRYAVKAAAKLAACVGAYGMIGGQQIDTQSEGESLDEDALLYMYELKTSGLLQAACCCGCIAGGGSEEAVRQADAYGKYLGLAFQLVDDILDVTGDEKTLGKPVGSDKENDKKTYVSLYGLEAAKEKAGFYTAEAMKALEYFNNNEFLVELTKQLLNRNR